MNIDIPLENGFLPDKYGKYSEGKERKYGNNICSFPIKISNVCKEAKSLALVFIDYDSTPVCGFTWIHWLACNIDPSLSFIPENASQANRDLFIQGKNSCYSRMNELDNNQTYLNAYIGPCPPDRDHMYTLKIYALDTALDLSEGYFLNEFHWAIQGHILESECVNIPSRA